MANLNTPEYQSFEDIKHSAENGAEYWLARELAPVLQYAKWENFQRVIDRAILACNNSGFNVPDHFPEVRKTVEMPSKAKPKTITDYRLSRYACYLIVQNGDPRKEVIALGQTYFAIQTRRQEVQDAFNQLDEDSKRLVVRGNIKQWNQLLADAAHAAGVIDDIEYAGFQNAGYVGLYGGETVQDIHDRKGLKPKEKILDFMNSSELAANLFRITLAEERLRSEPIWGADAASEAHYEVGKNVREAIVKSRGVLPEKQPTPTSSITEVERQKLRELKKKKNMLDE
jgi:DNA-damage-inducible protein D